MWLAALRNGFMVEMLSKGAPPLLRHHAHNSEETPGGLAGALEAGTQLIEHARVPVLCSDGICSLEMNTANLNGLYARLFQHDAAATTVLALPRAARQTSMPASVGHQKRRACDRTFWGHMARPVSALHPLLPDILTWLLIAESPVTQAIAA